MKLNALLFLLLNIPWHVFYATIMKEAMAISKLNTKKAVVETGLKLLVQIKKQERLRKLRGKLKWDGNLDAMRLDQ